MHEAYKLAVNGFFLEPKGLLSSKERRGFSRLARIVQSPYICDSRVLLNPRAFSFQEKGLVGPSSAISAIRREPKVLILINFLSYGRYYLGTYGFSLSHTHAQRIKKSFGISKSFALCRFPLLKILKRMGGETTANITSSLYTTD